MVTEAVDCVAHWDWGPERGVGSVSGTLIENMGHKSSGPKSWTLSMITLE